MRIPLLPCRSSLRYTYRSSLLDTSDRFLLHTTFPVLSFCSVLSHYLVPRALSSGAIAKSSITGGTRISRNPDLAILTSLSRGEKRVASTVTLQISVPAHCSTCASVWVGSTNPSVLQLLDRWRGMDDTQMDNPMFSMKKHLS
ncbi:hypothetical protein BD410DRAFT_164125 [Rickenella mellea]|uniref:Uncharacterized protein n=1 Tax=Rickenella mellea TaxID=50990 RepID=A0A4Y7Q9P7_9AGAM|nr:hypothetical protein BD410DRAFT_164125 [Rickenella mellea]